MKFAIFIKVNLMKYSAIVLFSFLLVACGAPKPTKVNGWDREPVNKVNVQEYLKGQNTNFWQK